MNSDFFPFPEVRSGQDELLEDIENAVNDGENILAHAPSGLGKTAASIPPALSNALQNDRTAFFLTPKHSQHQIAIETVKKITRKSSVEVSVADVIGKKWLCQVKGTDSFSSGDFKDYCKTLKKEERCTYYNNTRDEDLGISEPTKKKIKELKGRVHHAGEIKEKTGNLCPYEVLVQLSKRADFIVGDYFHIFHPGVREAFLTKADKKLKNCILIVDEAHNLPSRTRDLLSKRLSTYQVQRAQKEADNFGYLETGEILDYIEEILSRIGGDVDDHEERITEEKLTSKIEEVTGYEDLLDRLDSVAEEVYREKEKCYCSSIREFLEAWPGQDRGFTRIIRKNRSRKSGKLYYSCHYNCLNPQLSTQEPFEKAHSSVLMSATLVPMDMYSDLLGLGKGRTKHRAYTSPFPEENQVNLVVDSVTTRYKERDEEQYRKIGWFLSRSLEKVPGNASVFFPSYSLRDKVKKSIDTEKRTVLEERGMTKEDKRNVLNLFSKSSDSLLLGISGASFAEGVDFPERSMDAVFVVGLPLKEPDLETQALIDFYEYKFGRGWDYAYSYPAMKKALQAAGRCIRTKKDRGVVTFMDGRYLWENYRKVFPPETQLKKTDAPWKEIEEFFSKKGQLSS